MNYFVNKEARKNQARLWTKKMTAGYAKEIEESIKNSKIYSPNSVLNCSDPGEPQTVFLNTGTVEAAFQCGERYGKICLLNFASYKKAGGMFYEGSSAQEEMLCHSSFLYNVLSAFPEYYEKNRTRLNRGLYCDRAIYSPDILFFDKDGNSLKCDVVTCAAPNKSLIRYGNFDAEENLRVLKERCEFLKKVVEQHKPDTLILGAWGCGVFKQDPQEVYDCLNNAFSHTGVKVVIYAVPGSDKNANVFRENLS